MIIKKPYAFLIKNFKYIHGGLFLLLLFMTYKSFNILKFFNDYVKTGYYTFYDNLSGHFINFYVLIAIFLIIIVNSFLYLVMKAKDKKRLYYIVSCLFYFALFIVIIYVFSILRTIEIKTVDIRSIRIIRDILIIIVLPQIYFTVFALLRAVGFDIKSFNFKKDLEELDISEEDSEVIEVLIPNDSYKHMRKLRRFIRETKYFAIEYKFFFLVIILIMVSGIFLTLYLNISVYNKKYKESDEFISNNIKYNVKNSYLTSVDYGGNTINENKSYVIVVLNVENIDNVKHKLETEYLKLVVNDKEMLPILSKGDYFIDLGQAYNGQSIKPNTKQEYLIIYEIDKNLESSNYMFKIFTEVNYSGGEINSRNKNVSIYPEKVDALEISDEYNMGTEILLGESNLSKSKIIIKSVLINKSFEEKFNYCVEDYCYEGTKRFAPNIISSTPKAMMKLECNFEIDESKYVKKEIYDSSTFLSHFGTLYYSLGESAKTVSINVVTSEFIKSNKVFAEIPYEVLNAEKINLFITIRNIRYIIVLK